MTSTRSWLRPLPGFERPLWQWALLAACAVVVVLALAIAARERREAASVRGLQQQIEAGREREFDLERRLAREQSAREAFQIGLDRERAASAPPPAVALQPGFGPSGTPKQQLRVHPESDRVRLLLPIAGSRFERYRAAVRPFSGGDEVWVHAVLRPEADGRRLFLSVPSDALAPGAYELALSGVRRDGTRQDVGTFTFEVRIQ